MQVLLNILRGFGVQAALDAPRFCISAGSPETEGSSTGQSGDINSEVYFEDGIDAKTVETLRGAYSVFVGHRSSDLTVGQAWVTTRILQLDSNAACLGAARSFRRSTTLRVD